MRLTTIPRTISRGVRKLTTPLKRLPRRLKRIPRQFKQIPRTLKRVPKTLRKTVQSLSQFLQTALGLPVWLQLLPVTIAVALLSGVGAALAGVQTPVQRVTVPVVDVTVPLGVVSYEVASYAVPLLVAATLAVWPVLVVATGTVRWWTTHEHPIADRVVTTLVTRTGFVQRERLLGLGFATGVSLVSASLGCAGAYYLGIDSTAIAIGFAVGWPAGTVLALVTLWQRNQAYQRDDLAIVAVHERDGGTRELSLRNTGTTTIDLRKAKLQDTHRRRYQLAKRLVLDPGDTEMFALPAGFRLEPRETAVALPLGFEIERDRTMAAIYTRSGETFVLDWDTYEKRWAAVDSWQFGEQETT